MSDRGGDARSIVVEFLDGLDQTGETAHPAEIADELMMERRNPNRRCRMKRANDRLSRVASALAKADREMEESFADLHLFGGGCCGPIVLQGAARVVEKILDQFGYQSVVEVLDELEARTTYRWVYFSGLGALADLLER